MGVHMCTRVCEREYLGVELDGRQRAGGDDNRLEVIKHVLDRERRIEAG